MILKYDNISIARSTCPFEKNDIQNGQFYHFSSIYTNRWTHYLIMLIIYAILCDFEKSIDGLVMSCHDKSKIKHHILTSFIHFHTVLMARWPKFDHFKLIFGAQVTNYKIWPPPYIIAHCDQSIWPRKEKSTFLVLWDIGLAQ